MKIERGYPTYTVTPKAENAIVKGHPWVSVSYTHLTLPTN